MPIKSKAQRRKFAELLVEGKITPETFEEWNRGAGSKELPERLHPKTRSASKKKAAAKRPRPKGRKRAGTSRKSRPRPRAARTAKKR